jgi:hypothetical protein
MNCLACLIELANIALNRAKSNRFSNSAYVCNGIGVGILLLSPRSEASKFATDSNFEENCD